MILVILGWSSLLITTCGGGCRGGCSGGNGRGGNGRGGCHGGFVVVVMVVVVLGRLGWLSYLHIESSWTHTASTLVSLCDDATSLI